MTIAMLTFAVAGFFAYGLLGALTGAWYLIEVDGKRPGSYGRSDAEQARLEAFWWGVVWPVGLFMCLGCHLGETALERRRRVAEDRARLEAMMGELDG